MPILRRSRMQILLALLLIVGAGSIPSAAQDAPPPARTKPATKENPIPIAKSSPRRRGAMHRPITAEDITKAIAVAKDVSPEWAAQLTSGQEKNPEEFAQSIRQNGRRLFGLVMLKERDPVLYTVRVGELRCKRELADVGAKYREAVRDGRTEDAAVLETEIRALVKQSLDFEMRARGMELAALDKALRELKARLEEEVATRSERLEQRTKEVLAVEPQE